MLAVTSAGLAFLLCKHDHCSSNDGLGRDKENRLVHGLGLSAVSAALRSCISVFIFLMFKTHLGSIPKVFVPPHLC